MSTVTTDTLPAAAGALEQSEPLKPGVLVLNTKQVIGSAQHVHAMIARLLDKERFRVFVATPPECNEPMEWENVPEVKLWRLPMGLSVTKSKGMLGRVVAAVSGLQLVLTTLRLALRVRRDDITIIHTATTPRDALAGYLLSKLTGAALVVHWHHVFWGWYPLVWRLAFRQARAILAVSEESAGSLHPLGLASGKVHVLYNGIDTSRYHPDVDGQAVRSELGIHGDRPLVVLPGRLCPIKGQGDLLQAAAILKQRGCDLDILLVGDDDPYATPGGGSYKVQLEAMRRELGLEDRVFISPYRGDMPNVMAAADIIAVPSYDDPFPLVVLEALASGKPVVGTTSGGIPEEIEDELSGLLVPTGDVKALASALGRLGSDPELRQRLAAGARREAETRFSQEVMARNAAIIYERLLKDRSQPLPTVSVEG